LVEFLPNGRLFSFGQFSEKYKRSTNVLGAFFHGKSYVLRLTKNGLGYTLGDFLRISSGLSVSRSVCLPVKVLSD
jgi:hypothetical protein